MKKTVLTLLIAVCSVVSMSAQIWETFKSLDHEFKVLFPYEPQFQVQKVPSAVGELDMNMYMATATDLDSDNMLYSVIRSDYPTEMFENPTPEFIKSVLDGAVNGAVTNVQGKLLSDETISFNKFPGRSIKIETTMGLLYINTYLVNNSMFITQVICTPDKDNNESIKRFQESFELIKVN
ncbi:hypothetical protein [Psychroserpens sp.]|uniref:hypothetical protein n=1 Tax=Psychroserpens sp. TaxID=2020870 RepID=UPI001B151EB7|nr:hypothetical protein [Psychroserpens sp.]MBO6606456.1 hypothetical protein [Psychroserpens sp.]MBO6631652.1 hypothetical protein [Psychroserpens sp.]MBO6653160.1 hypothetical protein [Psychroserpens sp.]MBO6680812.1 hypothetical protein [Psychroserpens sp.]MBO6750230.1 hypothetical protein [Psychroserpens sp.]